MDDIDRAIRQRADDGIRLLTDLVRTPSTIGREGAAQEVLALALGEAGFGIDRLQIPLDIGDDPLAGVPQVPYEGRYDVVGRRLGTGGGRSLVLNGHMDVAPAEDAGAWSVPPFAGVVRDGWMIGRGAADMKSGYVAALLAVEALDASRPGWQRGDLTVLSVIEEQATGNGTLAACRAGVLADAALLLEPTGEEILLGGIGIVWVDIVLHGRAGHITAAGRAVNPISLTPILLEALKDFEAEMNAGHAAEPDPAFAGIPEPYVVNVGRIEAGLWPSSIPEAARLFVRVGHPAGWSSSEAVARVDAALQAAAAAHPWLADHPPVVRASGYRAERFVQDAGAPLVTTLAAAHAAVHGSLPVQEVAASTTDARYYVNGFGTPAVAYGPRTRNLHGIDESVELESVLSCASTIARFLLAWCGERA